MAKMNKRTEDSYIGRSMSMTAEKGSSVETLRPSGSQAPSQTLVADKPARVLTHQQIAERAKVIWRKKGCPAGQDEQNWLEAEAQLKREFAIK
jgi:hypothetical protein